MSLILDALRKSEAERRRGQAPDLFAPMPPPSRGRRRPALSPWILIVAIGVAVLGLAWWWNTRPAAPPQAPTIATALPAETAETAETAVAPSPSVATTNPPPMAAPPPPVAPAAGPAPSHPSAPSAPPAPAFAGAGSTHAPIAAPTPPAAATDTRPQPPSAPVAAADPQAGAAPASADSRTEETLPTLAALDAATRAALPPLKLSMHVWSETPARRFAIVDGQRVAEGSALGASVVSEIRRDGLVLDIGGRRFLLPRP